VFGFYFVGVLEDKKYQETLIEHKPNNIRHKHFFIDF